MTPCLPPSRRGLSMLERGARPPRRPALTEIARVNPLVHRLARADGASRRAMAPPAPRRFFFASSLAVELIDLHASSSTSVAGLCRASCGPDTPQDAPLHSDFVARCADAPSWRQPHRR